MADIELAKCRCGGEANCSEALRLLAVELRCLARPSKVGVDLFLQFEAIADQVDSVAKSMGDGWISVEDRLPDSDGRYNTADGDGEVDTDIFIVEEGCFMWECEPLHGIIHRQPLPSAPKAVEKRCPECSGALEYNNGFRDGRAVEFDVCDSCDYQSEDKAVEG